MFVQGGHVFAMFYAYAYGGVCAHMYVMIFSRFAQNYSIYRHCVPLLYAHSYTVALFSGPIPSFAELHTEKLAFQYAIL